jgi:hypothetical protein
MYNGVRDLSSCNHIGNLNVLRALAWDGAAEFLAAPNAPWPSAKNVQGHIRSAGCSTSPAGENACLLQFATVLRTGHLVPTVVPEAFKTLLALMIGE